jgi:N-methylhydantoinase A
MLTSDLRYEASQTHLGASTALSPETVRDLFARLEQQAAGRLRAWFDGPIRIERSAEMRYGAQVFEIDVPLDGLDWRAPMLNEEIEGRFHDRHEELYTYASRDQEVVFVNARVSAVGEVARHEHTRRAASGTPCSPPTRRKAFFDGWREVPLYAFAALEPGHVIDGPAIVEAETTTVVINSGDRITVNGLGWLDVSVR